MLGDLKAYALLVNCSFLRKEEKKSLVILYVFMKYLYSG